MINFAEKHTTMAEYPYLDNGDYVLDDRHEIFKMYGDSPSQCSTCKHFNSHGYFCKAFPWPSGIPDSILSGKKKHDKVWKSQTGETVYTPTSE